MRSAASQQTNELILQPHATFSEQRLHLSPDGIDRNNGATLSAPATSPHKADWQPRTQPSSNHAIRESEKWVVDVPTGWDRPRAAARTDGNFILQTLLKSWQPATGAIVGYGQLVGSVPEFGIPYLGV